MLPFFRQYFFGGSSTYEILWIRQDKMLPIFSKNFLGQVDLRNFAHFWPRIFVAISFMTILDKTGRNAVHFAPTSFLWPFDSESTDEIL